MIQFYHGNIHDVSHFLKVYAFAKTIGELERLTPQTQETLELESPPLIENFFAVLSFSQKTVQRITWLVAHHHTYGLSEDLDYQILLEADYIVNAGESDHPAKSVRSALQKIFKTKTGNELLSSLYLQ